MWIRLDVVRMFIEHTCPPGQPNHAIDANNALKLWKVKLFSILHQPRRKFRESPSLYIHRDISPSLYIHQLISTPAYNLPAYIYTSLYLPAELYTVGIKKCFIV